jgi:hypothetical protein
LVQLFGHLFGATIWRNYLMQLFGATIWSLIWCNYLVQLFDATIWCNYLITYLVQLFGATIWCNYLDYATIWSHCQPPEASFGTGTKYLHRPCTSLCMPTM